jgi:propanediol dehydratase small subunit
VDQQNLEQMIKDVLASMSSGSPTAPSGSSGGRVTAKDYPLGEKSVDKLKTPTGKSISEVTLDGVLSGNIGPQDVRIRAETLELQAQVAESVGRTNFAANLRRAAELIPVPDERLLQIYNALRPYHATKQELQAIAEELKTKYNATVSAKLVEEAIVVGEARGRLKKD